jgi:hypothetical protein
LSYDGLATQSPAQVTCDPVWDQGSMWRHHHVNAKLASVFPVRRRAAQPFSPGDCGCRLDFKVGLSQALELEGMDMCVSMKVRLHEIDETAFR